VPERIRRSVAQSDGHEAEAQVLEEIKNKASEELPKLAEIEGRYVARVLAHTNGNKQAASRLLGIDRKTLERMIKRHDINHKNTTSS
jgi:DNA-binding NtrC family response regulator